VIRPMSDGERALDANPKVSIILPTYNRDRFLLGAFGSISDQQFRDWELIVVDDGSTDQTHETVLEQTRGWSQPLRYVYQENLGAYGARNTGLELARGRYVAFFDSDDLWLPHHLSDCVSALDKNPDVTWVFGASRIVEPSGTVVEPNSFYRQGRPKSFLKLRTRRHGTLNIIEDRRATAYSIEYGLAGGLQNSLIRRRFFEKYRFTAKTSYDPEDQLTTIRALVLDHTIAYFDNVHVIYNIHDDNSSGAGAFSVEKHVRIHKAVTAGYERLSREPGFSASELRALRRRLSREYFWNLGYMMSRQPEARTEALAMLRRGLRTWCWDIGMWKCYVLAHLRLTLPARIRRGSALLERGRAGSHASASRRPPSVQVPRREDGEDEPPRPGNGDLPA
jgi:glycosyltransferase involved in cell wall biosynthesis